MMKWLKHAYFFTFDKEELFFCHFIVTVSDWNLIRFEQIFDTEC